MKDKIKVIYTLNQNERKIDVLNGGTGSEYVCKEIESSKELEKYLTFSKEGEPYIDLDRYKIVKNNKISISNNIDSEKVIEYIGLQRKFAIRHLSFSFVTMISIVILGITYINSIII